MNAKTTLVSMEVEEEQQQQQQQQQQASGPCVRGSATKFSGLSKPRL